VAEIKSVKIEIAGKEVELKLVEAEALWNTLGKVLEKNIFKLTPEYIPYPVYPNPYPWPTLYLGGDTDIPDGTIIATEGGANTAATN
jgi:hypothetical protein